MPNKFNGDAVTAWNDADVVGDLNSPEVTALLEKDFRALVGFSSKQRRGSWRLWSAPLRQFIDIKLSRHEARVDKDGDAMVFAHARTTGKSFKYPDSGMTLPLCGRSRGDIEAVTFAGYDIDDGDDLETAVERLRQLGYFAILYTTHSHGKARNEFGDETVDKYRILFPLDEPFELAPDHPVEHERRCQEWRERLVGFAERDLKLKIDESGCDVNRLYYTPRHKPGDRNWRSAIFAGRALSVSDMPYSPKPAQPSQRRGRSSDKSHTFTYNQSRPILMDGFDLIEWRRDWGRFFRVRDFFDFLQWDIGEMSRVRPEARILCPNDHAHSTFDDNHGCWIKDGDGEEPFVIYCHHNACEEMGSLDQLVELELNADLPDEYTSLSNLLCEPALYNASEVNGRSQSPDRRRYMRWDPRVAIRNDLAVSDKGMI